MVVPLNELAGERTLRSTIRPESFEEFDLNTLKQYEWIFVQVETASGSKYFMRKKDDGSFEILRKGKGDVSMDEVSVDASVLTVGKPLPFRHLVTSPIKSIRRIEVPDPDGWR